VKNCNSSFRAWTAGVITLLAVFWTVYAVFAYVIPAFAGIDAKLSAALAATAGTIIVSVALVVVARSIETRAATQQTTREKKIAVYEQLLQFMLRTFTGTKTGEPIPQADVIRFMTNFAQRIMVWGSNDVLEAWSAFRTTLADGSPDDLILAYEELVRTIRRDLGYQNPNLGPGELLSLFVDEVKAPTLASRPE